MIGFSSEKVSGLYNQFFQYRKLFTKRFYGLNVKLYLSDEFCTMRGGSMGIVFVKKLNLNNNGQHFCQKLLRINSRQSAHKIS